MRMARVVGLWVIASLITPAVALALTSPVGAATVRAAVSNAATVPPDAGRWSAPVTLFADSEGASIGAVSCSSAHSCVAVGTKGGTFGRGVGLSGATTWSSPEVVDNYGGLTGGVVRPGGPLCSHREEPQ